MALTPHQGNPSIRLPTFFAAPGFIKHNLRQPLVFGSAFAETINGAAVAGAHHGPTALPPQRGLQDRRTNRDISTP